MRSFVVLDVRVVENIKKQFPKVHPLIFQRSLEKSRSAGELFDIVSTVPLLYPVVWNDSVKRWVTTADNLQAEKFVQK